MSCCAKSFHIENRTVGESWHSEVHFATSESATSRRSAVPAVPSRIVIEIPVAEQVRWRNHLRRARWGGWLTLPILLLWGPAALADGDCRSAVLLAFDRLRGGLGLAAGTPSLGARLGPVYCPRCRPVSPPRAGAVCWLC
jgi:hypothetical protein